VKGTDQSPRHSLRAVFFISLNGPRVLSQRTVPNSGIADSLDEAKAAFRKSMGAGGSVKESFDR